MASTQYKEEMSGGGLQIRVGLGVSHNMTWTKLSRQYLLDVKRHSSFI